MADFKDERAYESKTLTQWFLGSSLALLVCVVLMVYFDFHRQFYDWKYYQHRFNNLQLRMDKEKLGEVSASVDLAAYDQLKADLKEANDDLNSKQQQTRELEDKEVSLNGKIYKLQKLDYNILKAQIGEDVYNYGEELKNGKTDNKLKKKINEENNEADSKNQQLFELGQAVTQTMTELADINQKKDDVTAKIKKMRADYDDLEGKIRQLRPPFRLFHIGTWGPWILFNIRNAPMLDFLSPTIQIQKLVLKNLPEDLYFAKTMRVDSCITCHQSIDKKGFEDAPEPFRTHPHLDWYVGSTSPHPMEKVGCTICHGGMGPAVSFNGCAHVPNDEDEAKKWAHKYGWTYPEGVQSVMVPLKYTEGSCLKCHGTQEHVNFAPKLNRGRELMVTRGCIGCHNVKGLEGLTKAGPSLYRVKGKLTREFVLKWVWSPKSFNPAARMPSFFNQSNNNATDYPDAYAKNKAELVALVDYIYSKSEDYTPNQAAPSGSIERGKKLFKEVGCLACHGIDDVTSYHADFAPDLSGTGSKLSANFVYTWIKNPQHFNPDTRMPSLRLSDAEAADITAYLMSKHNKDFDEASVPEFDPAVRDQLVVDYLKPQVGEGAANAQLLQMDENARQMFLGKKTLSKYGCFGCHMIRDFETAKGIGTDLTSPPWGTKPIGQLDFGFTNPEQIPHTHEGFLAAKLSDPRQFDKDKTVAFADKLKMPNFYLSDEDREAIMTAVLGLTDTYVPDDMTAGIHGNGPLLEKGRRVLSDFNCRGCHMIEAKGKSIDEILTTGQGGRILEMYRKEGIDYSMGPPNLNTEGAKLQMEWFHNFLLNVQPIRPWLHIRMPSFHWDDQKISSVITYFNLKDDQVFPYQSAAAPRLSGEDFSQAQQLFTQLQCQKCHVVGSHVPRDINSAAPDLLKVHKRLKPDWVEKWLEDPSAIMPDTRMTGFWPKDDQGKELPSSFKEFGGDGPKQREALRDYLFMLGGGKAEETQ